MVNIDPDQPATLFCSSDGLTRQQVIDQLKIEHGDGVLKQGPIMLPPHPTVLAPGTYAFKRRVSQGEELQIAASIVYTMCICQGQVEVYSGNKEPERPYIRPGAVFGTDCLQLFSFNLKLRLGRQRQL